MIRKLILSAVVATGTLTGLAASASNADAAAPVTFDRDRDRHGVRFEVQVRYRGYWKTYGTYRDRDDAQRVVRMLERKGRDARIEVERDRR